MATLAIPRSSLETGVSFQYLERYIDSADYLELISNLGGLGAKVIDREKDKWQIRGEEVPLSRRVAIRTKRALRLGAGNGIKSDLIEQGIKESGGAEQVGRGVCDLVGRWIDEMPKEDPDVPYIQDAYRFLCGYRLSYIRMLSINPSAAASYNLWDPPFLTSGFLAHIEQLDPKSGKTTPEGVVEELTPYEGMFEELTPWGFSEMPLCDIVSARDHNLADNRID